MKRILVLAPRFPFPVVRGDKLRIFHLCRGLAREHRLTLLALCESRREMEASVDRGVFAEVHRIYLPPWLSKLQALGALFTGEPLQIAYYRSRKFRKMVRLLAPEHDLVLAHLIRTAQYVEELRGMPRILEMTDALSRTYFRGQRLRGLGMMGRVYALEARRVLTYERRLLDKFDLVSLVSSTDRAFLLDGELERAPHVRIFTNGVDTSRTWVGSANVPCVVFIGHMQSTPNMDACVYFIEEVLPLVRRSVPEMRFRIIGSATPKTMRRLQSHPGVEATGHVRDVSEAIGSACCAVCPVRIGSGVQNKLLDYMALGLPAIVSPIALEGIRAQPGRDLLIARSSAEFASQVLSLYQDGELRTKVSLRARNLVERDHAWSSVWTRFSSAVSRLVAEDAPRALTPAVSSFPLSTVESVGADVRSTASG